MACRSVRFHIWPAWMAAARFALNTDILLVFLCKDPQAWQVRWGILKSSVIQLRVVLNVLFPGCHLYEPAESSVPHTAQLLLLVLSRLRCFYLTKFRVILVCFLNFCHNLWNYSVFKSDKRNVVRAGSKLPIGNALHASTIKKKKANIRFLTQILKTDRFQLLSWAT